MIALGLAAAACTPGAEGSTSSPAPLQATSEAPTLGALQVTVNGGAGVSVEMASRMPDVCAPSQICWFDYGTGTIRLRAEGEGFRHWLVNGKEYPGDPILFVQLPKGVEYVYVEPIYATKAGGVTLEPSPPSMPSMPSMPM